MTEAEQLPLINALMITEYANREDSTRWYMGFMGDIAEREHVLWEWVNDQIRADVNGLNQTSGGVLGASPNLAVDLTTVLKRWFARGFWFGMRREGVLYTPIVETTPLTDELQINRPNKQMPDQTRMLAVKSVCESA